jgi:hypothetical protein
MYLKIKNDKENEINVQTIIDEGKSSNKKRKKQTQTESTPMETYLKLNKAKLNVCMNWIDKRRLILNQKFIAFQQQDADEFLTSLLSTFCVEMDHFQIAHHFLFDIYFDYKSHCEKKHVSTKRVVSNRLQLNFDQSNANQSYTLLD